MTLDGLAELTGLTKSYLSKVERGQSVPSIATIMKLAQGLNVDIAQIFGQAAESESIYVERARGSRKTGRQGLNLVPIAAKRARKRMTPYIMHPSTDGEEHPNEHGGEEFLYVLDGEIEIEFPDRKIRLKAGDSVYFEGHLPHRQRSIGERATTLIVIETSSS